MIPDVDIPKKVFICVQFYYSFHYFISFYYPLAQQSCGGDIGSVPYVCM